MKRSLLKCFCILFSGAALVGGCAETSAPVNSGKARDSLKTVLDSWKSGGTIESLKNGSPSIIVQDMDWDAGSQLVSYQILSEGKDDDANLRIPVKLSLRDPSGKQTEKSVSYVVSTSPAITVFREFKP